MKKNYLVTALYICIMGNIQAQFQKAIPPVADKKEYMRVMHNDNVRDDYYWMYDYFGKGPDSTKVVDYLIAENVYTETVMGSTKKLQSDLFTEMKARIKEKDESVPVFTKGYYYYNRTDDGQEYFKYCRKKGSLDAKEEVLLDVDKWLLVITIFL